MVKMRFALLGGTAEELGAILEPSRSADIHGSASATFIRARPIHCSVPFNATTCSSSPPARTSLARRRILFSFFNCRWLLT